MFTKIHKLYLTDYNNKNIRDGIELKVQEIIALLIEDMWVLRFVAAGWSQNTNLPNYQKVWLDEYYKNERDTDDHWLDALSYDFARWFIATYEKIFGKMALGLDDIANP